MSKISLKPNDSGTGTFTLESPNSNTNRTLTLPDSDGTFVYQDSSGNVGIGTSSPSNRLEVAGDISIVTGKIISGGNQGVTYTSLQQFVANGGNAGFVADSDPSGLGRFAFGDGSLAGFVEYDHSSDSMQFAVNNSERMRIDSSGRVGIGTSSPSSTLDVNGSLSKNSGSFKIDHPLPEKSETHNLVHSFVESPRADNVYRGTATLSNGKAQVNLDTYIGMTEGTFSALNGNIDVFLQNKTGWEPLKGEVINNILHVYCKDETSTDTVSWMVVGERQDQHMLDTNWTDEFGRPILEPEKKTEEDIGDEEESN